ncbi:MAG: hypothetical protein KUL78_07370 [Flavobacterium sp.]|nr:hypothetical protein [Flavobacterium sp.]
MKRTQLIYSIEGLDAEELYNNYIAYLADLRTTRDFMPGDSPVVNAVAEQYLKNFSFKDPGTPSKIITINKFKVLVHILIVRNHEKETHTLNSTIIQQVIGPNYSLMLRSLEIHGILSKSDYFISGSSSYNYTINEPYEVRIRTNKNVYVQKELEKLNALFSKNEAKSRNDWRNKTFMKQYEKNLNKLKLHKYDYHNFINQLPYSEKSKVTYFEVLEKLENKNYHLTEDDRQRLYTTLTRTPKILKNFFNIRFQLDVRNSHPLLFSYFLINKYKIDFNVIKDINNIPYSRYNIYHNVGKNLCKKLKTSSQDFIKTNRIPTDVITYIYMTSIGRFWDYFQILPEFAHVPRYLIKKRLFEEVFYSRKLTSWQREFAKAFKSIYPTVYSTLREYRKEVIEKKGEHLAFKMTRIESEIFRKILKRTWDSGIETTNIHDALVLLDTKKNANVTEAQVDEIIKSVFSEYGLMVTTSVEYFSIDKAEKELKVLKENQDKISELKKELHETALYATDDVLFQRTIDLMSGLDDGSIEVVFEGGNPYLIFNN